MKYFLKFLRVIRNPKPYVAVFPYHFWRTNYVVKFYRKFLLPHLIRRIKKKNKVTVIFLPMNVSMWRYDDVYRRFAADSRFSPIVVTAVRNMPDVQQQIAEQATLLEFFSAKGYTVIPGLDVKSHQWLNLRSLKPDIIFYTQPYDGCIDKSLEYYNNLNSLICYTPYSFQLSETEWGWNNTLQQYCWKMFYVGADHLQTCRRLLRVGAENAVAAGYGFEEEFEASRKNLVELNRVWRDDKRKRIIWAPHHSINENEMFKVSSFLEIADLMVELRSEYKDKVIFAFKPHPILKMKLDKLWGAEKADAYYKGWAEADNSFDAQGDYHALFAGSDAMIHCSGSFIVEYLYTGKPVAYVYSKTRNPPSIGHVGDAALVAHYPIHNEKDIRAFLDNVVLEGKDTMCDIRRKVADKYLKSPNGKMFSENVYKSIVDGLEL